MKLFFYMVKVLFAGITAIAFLSIVFTGYSLTPVHIANPYHNTDYVWPADSVWVRCTEGISWGRFDSNGFNNSEVIDDPDVILLGSSHMEAANVMQDENVGYVLGRLLDGRYSVYNMGISGHHIYKVGQYLPESISRFEKTPLVAIVETDNVFLKGDDVKRMIEGTVEFTPSHDAGLVATFQKLPFFRVMYQQLQHGLMDILMEKNISETGSANKERLMDTSAYEDFFKYLKAIEDEFGTQIVIFYHPTETLNPDGSLSFAEGAECELFASYAAQYDIKYVDMRDSFLRLYEEKHVVPHGFSTGLIGSGHLNRFGHAAIADKLCDVIDELEEDGLLCR